MRKAFTLTEIIILIVFASVLIAVIIPKYVDLSQRTKEGYTKAALHDVRNALRVYKANHAGQYPDTLDLLVKEKYIDDIPVVKLPKTGLKETNKVSNKLDDTGGWFYQNDKNDAETYGNVLINCTRQDVQGDFVWSEL